MPLLTAQTAIALTVALITLTPSGSTLGAEAAQVKPRTTTATGRAHRLTPKAAPLLRCGDLLSFQVLLDRQGFSTGEIDGKSGVNFTRALTALQTARQLASTGKPDCDTWRALEGGDGEPAIITYTVSDNDLKGPFEKQIPHELAQQATLPELGYQSSLERLAERFHASPALLQRLNKGATLTAGRELRVPGVTPFDPDANSTPHSAASDVTIQVTRSESALRATRADGTVVFYAPVTTGSLHDPLPPGDWKVTGIDWHPMFHYNPDLFWDANVRDEKATIKPGPNNPVGVVWIGLNLEHYGLHGTPEPGHIGHTESHGCVRLTNWDAARVAALVKPGTPVLFR